MSQLPNSPYQKATVVVPSDATDVKVRGLYVGMGGDIKLTTKGGSTVTLIGVQGGTFVPVAVVKVFATDTNASNIMGMN